MISSPTSQNKSMISSSTSSFDNCTSRVYTMLGCLVLVSEVLVWSMDIPPLGIHFFFFLFLCLVLVSFPFYFSLHVASSALQLLAVCRHRNLSHVSLPRIRLRNYLSLRIRGETPGRSRVPRLASRRSFQRPPRGGGGTADRGCPGPQGCGALWAASRGAAPQR